MPNEDLDDISLDGIFPEEERPPSPEPSTSVYTRERTDLPSDVWRSLNIRLVGSHPLWAHHLWNAALALGTYLDDHLDLYKDKNVLELGAGGGLPGIVTAKNGARKVVLTDYPDNPLLDNLRFNVDSNHIKDDLVSVQGYIWGRDVQPLLNLLASKAERYDLMILSDLIFNHSQHDALLKTCKEALASSGTVLVFYSHHRPHLADRDLQFFEKAKEGGWACDEVLARRFEPMFPEDPGDAEVRSTVHGWVLRRP